MGRQSASERDSESAVLEWLSSADNPAVRYLTVRELADPRPSDHALALLRRDMQGWAPLQQILALQLDDGSFPYGQKTPTMQPTFWVLCLMARCGLDTGDEPVLRAAREGLRHEAHRPGPLRADENAFTVSDVSVDHDPQGVRLRPSLVERAVGHAGQLLRYGPQELGVVGVVGSVVGWHDLRVSALFHEAARPEVLTADRVGIG